MDLDQLDIASCVRRINDLDHDVPAAVRRAADSITAFITDVLARMTHAASLHPTARLIYIGAGTSGRLGVLDAAECIPTFCVPPGMIVALIAGGDPALRQSSESLEDDPAGADKALTELNLSPHDAVLGIAAGGTTPYVRGALSCAHKHGCLTGLLTCSPQAPHDTTLNHRIVIETDPEPLTGSTRMKAGTATKLVLNTISTTLMVQLGKVYENLMVDLRATNAKLRDRAARIIATVCEIDRPHALTCLDAAGGSCKTAIVMHKLNLSQQDAEHELAQANGHLRTALARHHTPI